MHSATDWVMTTRGPKQVRDLIGIPFMTDEETYALRGFESQGFMEPLQITSQGHTITLAPDAPVAVNSKVTMLARDIRKNQDLEVFPLIGFDWDGIGGSFYWGEVLGEAMLRENADDAGALIINAGLGYLKDAGGELFLSLWRDPDAIEKASSEFYSGFLKVVAGTLLRKHEGIYSSVNTSCFPAERIRRMLLRIGVVTVSGDTTHVFVYPSYSLKAYLFNANGLGAPQGESFWREVGEVMTPETQTVSVDQIKKLPTQEMYSAELSHGDGFLDVNGFRVYQTST